MRCPPSHAPIPLRDAGHATGSGAVQPERCTPSGPTMLESLPVGHGVTTAHLILSDHPGQVWKSNSRSKGLEG
uniref:Uncharacterized protein n=1 Tax=Ascaris lumbricoides TaxID=6252 RepID=A0A0M3IB86_ASCLU